MSTSTSATSRRRDPMYFKVGTNSYVRLNLKKSSFNSALFTAMGALNDVPDGGIIVATNREDALARGVFFLNIGYQATRTRVQSQKIPIAPDKADTAFAALRGLKYRNKDIVDVRVPRRRKFEV
ncbi:MAG: hypothetical protein AB8B99_03020 [Phormidesmis sp.]